MINLPSSLFFFFCLPSLSFCKMENQQLQVDTMNLKTTKQALETSHTDRLSDTAEVVREVSKKIGKYSFI